MVPGMRAPGAGPTPCREGLFGVEPFAQDPGWGQERPGWACAGAGGASLWLPCRFSHSPHPVVPHQGGHQHGRCRAQTAEVKGLQPSWTLHLPLPGEGNGNPLQYPCLENPMDQGSW